jgi:hypothetical protein
MKKIRVAGFAFFALFAFGMVAAATASALEWLVEKAAVVAPLSAEAEGLLEVVKFNESKGTSRLDTVDCEGILDGTIGPVNAAGNGVDEFTKLLNLAQEEILGLGELALECKVTQTAGGLADCKSGVIALVWDQNLPWLTELELMEPKTGEVLNLDLLFKNASDTNKEPPAYEVECETVSGIIGSELCEGNTSLNVENEPLATPAAVLAVSNEEVSERGACNLTGAGSIVSIGDSNIWAISAQLVRLATEISGG